jgi:hypothetical protein
MEKKKMKQSVSREEFVRAFDEMNRGDNFSALGRRKLFDYLTELEEDTGSEIELDVIAICCDFSEESLSDVLKNYSLESIDELRDNTTVIEVDDETVIYQNY